MRESERGSEREGASEFTTGRLALVCAYTTAFGFSVDADGDIKCSLTGLGLSVDGSLPRLHNGRRGKPGELGRAYVNMLFLLDRMKR